MKILENALGVAYILGMARVYTVQRIPSEIQYQFVRLEAHNHPAKCDQLKTKQFIGLMGHSYINFKDRCHEGVVKKLTKPKACSEYKNSSGSSFSHSNFKYDENNCLNRFLHHDLCDSLVKNYDKAYDKEQGLFSVFTSHDESKKYVKCRLKKPTITEVATSNSGEDEFFDDFDDDDFGDGNIIKKTNWYEEIILSKSRCEDLRDETLSNHCNSFLE